ncbi:hypothetical protein BDY24DRAFT_382570 [Mrakia frigida]|uniref:forkhead box transcription factor n=1 Tax=Mrakia frigida TaxID=29902 RepID=UPI003FCC0935
MSDSEGEAVSAPRILGKDDGQATYIGLPKALQVDTTPLKGKAAKPGKKPSKPLSRKASTSSLASSVASSSKSARVEQHLPSDDDDFPLAQVQQQKRDYSSLVGEEGGDAGGRGGAGGGRGGDKKTLVLEDVKFGPESDEKKPEPTYYTLLKHALLFSPQKKLTLAQIYEALEGRWPWFSKAGKGWKNTVRNNLSLGPSFQKVEASSVAQELGNLERGTYWSFNPDAPEGCPRHERQKKRGRATSKIEEEKTAPAGTPRGRRKSDPFSDVEEESEMVDIPGIVEGGSEEAKLSSGETKDVFDRGKDAGGDQDSLRSTGSTTFASLNASTASLPLYGSRPIPIPSPLVLSPSQPETSSTLSPMSSSPLSPLSSPIERAAASSPSPVFHMMPFSPSSFDPVDPTLSLFNSPSPLSANSPPLTPSSASTSYSSLESWYSPPSRVPSCLPGTTNDFGFSTSTTSNSSSDDPRFPLPLAPLSKQQRPTFLPPSGLPAKLQLHYPSHPLDSPSSEFIHNPSSSNEKETPFFFPGLTPKASELPPKSSSASDQSSFLLLATQAQPPHQPSPLQNIELPGGYSPSSSSSSALEPTPHNRHPLGLAGPSTSGAVPFNPPRFERDNFSSSSSTFEVGGRIPALGLRGLGVGMEDVMMEEEAALSDADAEGEEVDEEEEEEETRREDLSVVLAGKSAEFWRGLWAGWNAASPGAVEGGAFGGEGRGEGASSG